MTKKYIMIACKYTEDDMDKNQQLINLFFETDNKRIEESILAQIQQNNERPIDLYEQYKNSINQVLKYSIIRSI